MQDDIGKSNKKIKLKKPTKIRLLNKNVVPL